MKKIASILLLVILFSCFIKIQESFAQDERVCSDTLPTRLLDTTVARVTPGAANNIRAEAHSGSARLGQIPGGESFTILDGPVCGEGFIWWQIRYGNIEGWTIEADNSSYFVEPLDGNDTDNQSEDTPVKQDCSEIGSEPRLQIGEYGRSSSDVPSRVREGAGLDFPQIGQIQPNEEFVVLNGPVCADDFYWWYVRVLSSSVEGWIAEGSSTEYFVEPIVPTELPATTTSYPTEISTIQVNTPMTETPSPTATESFIGLENSSVDWANDRNYVLTVAGRNTIYVYDFDSASLTVPTRSITSEETIFRARFHPLNSDIIFYTEGWRSNSDEPFQWSIHSNISGEDGASFEINLGLILEDSPNGEERSNPGEIIPYFEISPDGEYLFIPSDNGGYIWHPETGEFLRFANSSSALPIINGCFSANGQQLAVIQGHYVWVYDLFDFADIFSDSDSHAFEATGRQVSQQVAGSTWSYDFGYYPAPLAFTPNGESLVFMSGDNVNVLDLQTEQILVRNVLEDNVGGWGIWGLDMSPNGEQFVIAESFDQTLRSGGHAILRILGIDSAVAQDAVDTFSGTVLDVVYSPDGDRIAAAVSDGVQIYEASTLTLILEIHTRN